MDTTGGKMDLSALKEQFLVDDDVTADRLARIIEKLLPFCLVDKKGQVEIKRVDLSGRDLVKLVLAARSAANKLDGSVSDAVNAEEIAAFTGLPKNQASARAKESVDEGFAERSGRGKYRARLRRLGSFLDELATSEKRS